jgi:hypothetical protein
VRPTVETAAAALRFARVAGQVVNATVTEPSDSPPEFWAVITAE